MKTIKVKYWSEVPDKFTGKVEYESGSVQYLLNRKLHSLDGPAYIGSDGYSQYCIDGNLIGGLDNKDCKQKFYNSKEYKQWIFLENMNLIKGVNI